MFLVVLGSETVLAGSVEKTLMEYSQFVSPDSRDALQAWQFGQIIPFFMLLQPLLEALRAALPHIVLKRNARKGATGDVSVAEDGTESGDSKLSPKVTTVVEGELFERKTTARANTSDAHEELA